MSSIPPTSMSDPQAHSTLDESLHARRVRQVELLISVLLRTGVLLSLAIVLTGTISTFAHHHEYLSSPQAREKLLSSEAEFPHSVRNVLIGVAHMQGGAIVMLGLLLLIATPVMRVAVSILGFVYEHDPMYVVVTSIVLILLLLSFVLGKATAG